MSMVCPNCKSILSDGSKFCVMCGTKIQSAVTNEEVLHGNGGEQVLSETKIMEIFGELPIVVLRAYIVRSSDSDEPFLRCTFRSLTDRPISALRFDVLCFDVWGNSLSGVCDAQILDLNSKRNEIFGDSQKIALTDPATRSVKILLKKLRYSDGTICQCSGDTLSVPPTVPLVDYFNSRELAQQYARELSPKAMVAPAEFGDFWMCACERINIKSERICTSCGAEKKTAFHCLDKAFLWEKYQQLMDQKRKQEDRLRQERELARAAQIEREKHLERQKHEAAIVAKEKRRKKTKRTILLLGIIVLVLAISVEGFFVVKRINDKAYLAQERNIGVHVMSDDFTNVYGHIVALEPKFTVSQYGTESPSHLICKCVTVEGREVWLSVPTNLYSEMLDDSGENSNAGYVRQDFKKPVRVYGHMATFGEAVNNPPSDLRNSLVLCVDGVGYQ